MPTLVSDVAPFVPLILPRTRELLWFTEALKPIAVALVMFAAPFAEAPMKLLLLSTVFDAPLFAPIKVLLPPLLFERPESLPKNELRSPPVFEMPELRP